MFYIMSQTRSSPASSDFPSFALVLAEPQWLPDLMSHMGPWWGKSPIPRLRVSPDGQQGWECHWRCGRAGNVTGRAAGLGMSQDGQQGWECHWMGRRAGNVTGRAAGLCCKRGAGAFQCLLSGTAATQESLQQMSLGCHTGE